MQIHADPDSKHWYNFDFVKMFHRRVKKFLGRDVLDNTESGIRNSHVKLLMSVVLPNEWTFSNFVIGELNTTNENIFIRGRKKE